MNVFCLFILFNWKHHTMLYVATSPAIEKLLNAGKAVISDRYAFSGIAFSSSKVTRDGPGDPLLSFEWCKSPEIGLPAPDLVLFLDIMPEKAKERGGYGEEVFSSDWRGGNGFRRREF